MFIRPLSYNRIDKIKFSYSTNEELKKSSAVTVTSTEYYKNNFPVEKGLYDPHLGTTDYNVKCATCYNPKHLCNGHYGIIESPLPLWIGSGIKDARKWLRVICFNCYKPIFSNEVINNIKVSDKLTELYKATNAPSNSLKTCAHCKTEHPKIKTNIDNIFTFISETSPDNFTILYPNHCQVYFNGISDETVKLLGRNTHPKLSINTIIKVPPNLVRPDVKKIQSGKSNTDEITVLFNHMLKEMSKISGVPDVIDEKFGKLYVKLCTFYYNLIKNKNEDTVNSIRRRLKGKRGFLRSNLLGKRTGNITRGTITGSPKIKTDELGAPQYFAKTVFIVETVHPFNIKRMATLVNNGIGIYPGISKIVRNGREIKPDFSKEPIKVELGDKIYRNLMYNDYILFNRQPSLTLSNICGHRIRINKDKYDRSYKMNTSACPWYNADFDGDAMNGIINAHPAARNEVELIAGAHNMLLSHAKSVPAIGQVDDGIICSAQLTREDVKFDLYHYMLLFSNVDRLPIIHNPKKFMATGRDAVSDILSDTPINFNRKTTWYNPQLEEFIKYKDSEKFVSIEAGKMNSGILDKASIAKNAEGGLYQIIARDYGEKKALSKIDAMQQMSISYGYQFGWTISLGDILVNEKSKREIEDKRCDIRSKAQINNDRLDNNEIIPPINKTVKEFHEEIQINTLSAGDDFIKPILESIDIKNNGLFNLIGTGSKGTIHNLTHISADIGQKLTNGNRTEEKFSTNRISKYYKRHDNSPNSRGYIPFSYNQGMDSTSYIANAEASRFDLISKALSTSVTGYQNRKSVKNLESIITNNLRNAIKDNRILLVLYGGDGADPRYVEWNKFPTVMISLADLHKEFNVEEPTKASSAFFDKIVADRNKYRKIFMRMELSRTQRAMEDKKQLPVHIERTIRNVITDIKKSTNKVTADVLDGVIGIVDSFCSAVRYLHGNKNIIKMVDVPPTYKKYKYATWLLAMNIRSYLSPNKCYKLVADYGGDVAEKILYLIFEKITFVFKKSLVSPGTACGLIAAQSFSEPLTQYMLDAHHRSATGGTKRNVMVQVKEVLGATQIDSLQAPLMFIPLKNTVNKSLIQVKKIAEEIEELKFQQVVHSWQVFGAEKFKEAVHPKYISDNIWVDEYMKRNPAIPQPNDLHRYCIRFALNISELVLKHISIEQIVSRLRELYPGLFFVFTPEISENVIIRVYIHSNMYKESQVENIIKIKDELMTTVIRGVSGVINCNIIETMYSEIQDDDSIKAEKKYAISAIGHNIIDVCLHSDVDVTQININAIKIIEHYLGICSAFTSVEHEIYDIIKDINSRHYEIYAAEMTYTGRVTSIEAFGLKSRSANAVLLQAGFSNPDAALDDAFNNAKTDNLSTITSSLIVGQIPNIGTFYNPMVVDIDFVQKHTKSTSAMLDELL